MKTEDEEGEDEHFCRGLLSPEQHRQHSGRPLVLKASCVLFQAADDVRLCCQETTEQRQCFQHLKKMDNSIMTEKHTHYFDEKQLVCSQLGAEFTLLVKFAVGGNSFFI